MNHVPARPSHTVSRPAFRKAGRACLRASPACRVSGFERYDAAQQLASVSLPTGTLSLADRQWSAPKKITFPGGSVQTRDYDALLRPTRIKVSDPGQSTLIDRQYSFDPESNITKKSTEHGDYGYGYDDLYRLTTVDSPSGLPDEAWTYDKLGNRLTDETKPGDWQYNANNQLTQSYTTDGEAVTHSYDENGSLTQQTSPSGEATDNQRYVYDAQNRLVEVQDKDGNTIAVYQYDPYGRRIAKTVQQNGSSTTSNTTYYLYSDEGLIGEATQTGTLAVEYGWQPPNMWGTDPLYIRTTKTNGSEAEVFYYQNDHLGTPQAIVDQQGNVVWQAKALAFGETTVSTEASITNNLRFPGQYEDQETKTHYNYFRDYDPNTGRYRESDPVGFRGGMNIYAYVRNNPAKQLDTRGLFDHGRNWYAREHNIPLSQVPDDIPLGHSDFSGNEYFDYTMEDRDLLTSPLKDPARHFMDLPDSKRDVEEAIKACSSDKFRRAMHRLQDYFSHRQKGYVWKPGDSSKPCNGYGHVFIPILVYEGDSRCVNDSAKENSPDNDPFAWQAAENLTEMYLERYKRECPSCALQNGYGPTLPPQYRR